MYFWKAFVRLSQVDSSCARKICAGSLINLHSYSACNDWFIYDVEAHYTARVWVRLQAYCDHSNTVPIL